MNAIAPLTANRTPGSTIDDVLAMELYPWHSENLNGGVKADHGAPKQKRPEDEQVIVLSPTHQGQTCRGSKKGAEAQKIDCPECRSPRVANRAESSAVICSCASRGQASPCLRI